MGWLTAPRKWLTARCWQFAEIDPELLRFGAWVSLWARWLVWLAILGELVYRPETWYPHKSGFLLLHGPLVLFNGLLHYWLVSKRPVTWHWLVGLSAMDIALITGGLLIEGEFRSIHHLGYYPALGLIAVLLSSLSFTLVWTTLVAAFYTIVSLTQGSGLDLDSLDDKALFARVGAMYALVVIVGLIVRFERNRRRESVERERTLQRERSEISRTIHDNVAQTAYMIGLGIYQARRLADESNDELTSTLDATADLARAAMWELRRPLDSGQIYEGASLVVALESHVATFTTITSVPAKVVTYGEEPALSTETRSRLFSIAHNALTNAFRHSHAGKIEVELEYNSDSLRMSISDDGVGLPDDYVQRGYGFAGMRGDAEAVGGRFTVASGGSGGGTTVTCRVTF